MKFFFTTFFLATMATTTFAHMEMLPLRLVGTAAGGSGASWAAGSEQKFTIVGGAPHDGGSCQASLSFDSGKTFKAIHSYIGNCPLVPDYKFTVPADAKAGPAVFAWTWFNKVGNREMYMNCASVTITAGSGSAAIFCSLTQDQTSPTTAPAQPPQSDPAPASPAAVAGSGSGSGSGNTVASASVVAPTGFTTSIIPSTTNTAQSGSTAPKTPPAAHSPPPRTASAAAPKHALVRHLGSAAPNTGTAALQPLIAVRVAIPPSARADPLPVSNAVAGTNSSDGVLTVSSDGVRGDSNVRWLGVWTVLLAGCNSAFGNCGASVGTKSSLAVANVAGSKPEGGEMVTKTETEVVYSTVYVTDRAAATVNDVGGRSTFQTVTRAETERRSGITVIPAVVPR
ncbi:hypothetical protein VE04_08804 [Pseudogymnoascus sp. 24MN13]|nr:hypothetical protein VE04_08804 [Pseudogymnoascus sp. 24MN13]